MLGPHDPPPLTPWVKAGVAQRVHAIALHAYDLIIGLQLANLPVDGCITKAPCGGDKAGPSPVDRCKGGRNRSVATDGHGVRLGVVSAGANGRDSPLLAPTLAAAAVQVGPLPKRPTAHLDAGDDRGGTRDLLAELGFDGEISGNGVPAPIQVGNRWVVERTHSPMNSYGKLRRRTDKDSDIVDFFLYLTAAIVTVRQLIQSSNEHAPATARTPAPPSNASSATYCRSLLVTQRGPSPHATPPRPPRSRRS